MGTGGRLYKGNAITGTNAAADPLFVDGHAVYSAYFEGGMGFRQNVRPEARPPFSKGGSEGFCWTWWLIVHILILERLPYILRDSTGCETLPNTTDA